MSDDPPSSSSARLGVWRQRLTRWLEREPADRQAVVQLLRRAEARHLIDNDTLTMLEGALQVSEMHVRDIMIPRGQMVVLEASDDPQDLLPVVVESGHSRFPVVDPRHDRVIGILLAKDLLAGMAQESAEFRLKDVLRPAVFVPESKRLNVLLREFRTSRNHLAIVVDEYGGTAGLVSIEDVIEQIVGDIDDEYDVDADYVRAHRGQRYTVDARMPIGEFNEYFGTAIPDEDFDTIGGAVIAHFGSQPQRGDSVEFAGLSFTVLRADRRRIWTMRVSRRGTGGVPAEGGSEAEGAGGR